MTVQRGELPTPPSNARVWPWHQDLTHTPQLSLHASKSTPRISVITPSFNQGAFIEKTIRSVLLQSYPNLEYFVIDGGSNDGTLEVLHRYSPWITSWVSEKDCGQSHAINKGFRQATGDILCWLNSDDYFAPNALWRVAGLLAPPSTSYAVAGQCVRLFEDGRPSRLETCGGSSLHELLSYWKPYGMHQPSIFWRREVFEKIGYLREDLHLVMDYEYWLRIAEQFQFQELSEVLSFSHFHQGAKTSDNFIEYSAQRRRLAREFRKKLPLHSRVVLHAAEWLNALRSTQEKMNGE